MIQAVFRILCIAPILATDVHSTMPSSASAIGNKAPKSSSLISPKEMKELKRVYEILCNYGSKSRGNRRKHQEDRDASFDDESTFMSVSTAAGTEFSSSNSSSSQTNNHIRVRDIAAALRDLGRKATKQEATDMMWEVDENMDGVCDWDEFLLMFERNIRDTSGLEPANFYHLVQFMIYDHDNNGMVSIDEAMNILYARLGREKMEATINKLFSDDGAPVEEVGNQGGEINFARFWKVAQSEQTRALREHMRRCELPKN